MRLRGLLAVLVLVVACALSVGPCDVGISRADTETTGMSLFWDAQVAAPWALAADLAALALHVSGGPTSTRNALAACVIRTGGGGGFGQHFRVRILASENPAARPCLSLEILERSLVYLGVWAEGSVVVKWRFAREGPLPDVVFKDGAWMRAAQPDGAAGAGGARAHFVPGASLAAAQPDGTAGAGGGLCGVVTVRWRGYGLFTSYHADAGMANAVVNQILVSLRRGW